MNKNPGIRGAAEIITPKLEGLLVEVEAGITAGKISQSYATVDSFVTALKR